MPVPVPVAEPASAETTSFGQWWTPDLPAHGGKVLVLALGNDILRDDAVGLRVVRALREHLEPEDSIIPVETSEMGLSLLDYMVGFENVIVVDSVRLGEAPPGFLHEVTEDSLKVLRAISPHFLGVGEVLELGRVLGMDMPRTLKIFAIEVEDPFTLAVGLTEPVEAALPAITQRVLATARTLALT